MRNTIGKILISYDVNKLHTSVKEGLLKIGYMDNFKYQGETNTYYLPNTTLWHSKKTSSQAIKDLKKICNELGVTLEKVISVLASEFTAV